MQVWTNNLIPTRLDGHVALITGAASGIGRATAIRFANEGASVMCADINRDGAEATADQILREQQKAASIHIDTADVDSVVSAINKTTDQFGDFSVLFNNAGVAGRDWHTTIDINLTGVFYGLKEAAPRLAKRGGGVILNTASVAGLVGLIGMQPAEPTGEIPDFGGAGAYIASKHGVSGLTKQFAIAYGRFNVRVNAIAPGYIRTPMTAELRSVEEYEKFLVSLHPINRIGEPEEIAAAAAFLASDDASFITGVVLPVDGGYTAR